MNDQSAKTQSVFLVILALCGIVWGARLVPLLCPDCRLWGFNHLVYSGDILFALFCFFGVLLIIQLWPRCNRFFQSTCEFIAGSFNRVYFGRWAFGAVISMGIFWLFKVSVTLLGDGYAVIHNIGNDIPIVFKWSESGSIYAISLIASLLPVEGLQRGELAYAIVSVISGGISVFLFAAIAYELGRNGIERLFAYGVLLLSGWALLFFGYAENYPLLWPFVLLYIYTAIRYLSGKGRLLWPLLIIIFSCFLHLQIVFLAGSVVILLFARGSSKVLFEKNKRILLGAIGVFITAGFAYFIWRYNTSLGFQVHFLPPFIGRTGTPGYAVFSIRHILDLFNLSMLLVPIWPVMLYLSLPSIKKITHDSIALFLLTMSIGCVLFTCILDPRLGMARDWDLFALSCLAPSLFLIRLSMGHRLTSRVTPLILLTLLCATLPYIVTNTSRESTISYFESLCDLDVDRSRTGLVTLRNYLEDSGEPEPAAEVDAKLRHRFPFANFGTRVQELVKQNKLDAALVIADSLFRINPYVVDGYNMKGAVYLKMRQLDSARHYLEKSIELGRYEYRSHVRLAEVHAFAGNMDKMWDELLIARDLNPNEFSVIHPLAMSYYADKKYDSALVYGRRLIENNPDYPDGYLITGLSLVIKKEYANAKTHLEKYLEIGKSPNYIPVVEKTLREINRIQGNQ